MNSPQLVQRWITRRPSRAPLQNGSVSASTTGSGLAGTIVESDVDTLASGTEVVAHGYDLGVSRHGGFAEYARVPAEWLVPVPTGLTLRDTMVIGTAGYTAALSVLALEERGLT